ADLDVRETLERHTGLIEEGLDRLLVVLNRRLLEQDGLLEETVEAPLGDLGDRLLGLALLARGGLGDLALLGDDVGGDVLTREVARTHRCDLHRNTAGDVMTAVA